MKMWETCKKATHLWKNGREVIVQNHMWKMWKMWKTQGKSIKKRRIS